MEVELGFDRNADGIVGHDNLAFGFHLIAES
jgi:hypothetical protein